MGNAITPSSPIFRYEARRVLFLVGPMLVSATAFAIVALFLIYTARARPSAFDTDPLYFELVPTLASAVFFGGAFFQYQRLRPIYVDEVKIASMTYRGHIKTVIKWVDIRRITKIRGFDFFLSKNRFFFEIDGPSGNIYFDDLIQDQRYLLNAINEQIAAHDIEAVYIDRSSDALAEIRRTVSDPTERRKLLRNGRIFKVTAF